MTCWYSVPVLLHFENKFEHDAGHGFVPAAACCAMGAPALVPGPQRLQSDVNSARRPGMEDGYPSIDDLGPASSTDTRAWR